MGIEWVLIKGNRIFKLLRNPLLHDLREIDKSFKSCDLFFEIRARGNARSQEAFTVKAQNTDYVIVVAKNQGSLYKRVEKLFKTASANNFEGLMRLKN